MTTLREAAQQALEAMETWTPTFKMAIERKEKAITALKAALAEPVQKPLSIEQIEEAWDKSNFNGRPNIGFARAIERAHGIKNE